MQTKSREARIIRTLAGMSVLLTTLTLATGVRAQRVYGVTDKNLFGVLDLGTGAFQNLGTTTSSTTGNAVTFLGLGYNRGNNLFYGVNTNNVIYAVNPVSSFSAAGVIAAPQAQIQGLGTNRYVESLAFRNTDNTLFALVADGNGDNAALYTINLNTYAATQVGSLGSNFSTLGSLTIVDSVSGPVAYVTEGNRLNNVNSIASTGNGAVFTVDLSSGVVSRIASSTTAGFASQTYAPVAYGNQLYAADYYSGSTSLAGTTAQTYNVNQATGAATLLSNAYNVNAYGGIFALSTGAIPEPGTLALVAPALLGAGVFVRRRRKI